MVTWCRLSGDRDQKSHIAVGERRFTDVVRVSTYLADLTDMDGLHTVRREIFPEGDFPVATVTEAKLGLPGLLVEIEATAVIGST